MHQTPSCQLYTHAKDAKAESESNARLTRFMPMSIVLHVWHSELHTLGLVFNHTQKVFLTSLTWKEAFSCPKREVSVLASARSSQTQTKAIHQAPSILFSI